ncbi:hypothetical protein FOZ60_013782 [Perkinsus olseni]|uniref:PHR domain-containing protein n=1 Tax=Perkinsus olseni TaxID=32597 RepID=A0A7J6P7V2_PEROL|nr:hypothetical protein FOZ60_013782 [Perkinsus olseni]
MSDTFSYAQEKRNSRRGPSRHAICMSRLCGQSCCSELGDEVLIARRFSGPVRFDGLSLEEGKENHSVSFQTNFPVSIIGFEMFTSRTSKVPVAFTFVEGTGIVGRVLSKGRTSLGKSKSKLKPTKNLLLKKPVAIFENTWYTLNVEYPISDESNCISLASGSAGERFVTEGGVTFTFTGGLESHEATDVSKGQIPGVIFCPDEERETRQLNKNVDYEHLRSASAPNRDHLQLIEKQASIRPVLRSQAQRCSSSSSSRC